MSQTNETIAHKAIQSIKDFNDRVEYLATVDIGFMSQPLCLLQYFEDIKDRKDPFADAKKIAEIFKRNAGPIIIERESSYCFGKYQTIMDSLNIDDGFHDAYPISGWLFERVFKEAGLKAASECDEKELRELYEGDNRYKGFRQ